ncbi:MAG: radical SAM protein [Victivallales bacterium]|nr:radical SAM protein [Victivallales bacterium]
MTTGNKYHGKILRHVFGPVPSRRLGHSLGVDLVPYKVCSFDCIYCQLGSTTLKTIERKEYVPMDELIEDVKLKLSEKHVIDYITLSGSGEPTLYSRIAELTQAIKNITDIPVALITNGSMLWDAEVRRDLRNLDLVIPSLDAGNSQLFSEVNRPYPELDFDMVVEGLKIFSREFKGRIWLEVFLLEGFSDLEQTVEEIAGLIDDIKLEKIQLNTVARPVCEKSARPVSRERLLMLTKLFRQPTEVIADFKNNADIFDDSVNENDIINLLSRRPCSCKDIADSLCMPYNEALKIIEQLLRNHTIISEEQNGIVFYKKKIYK